MPPDLPSPLPEACPSPQGGLEPLFLIRGLPSVGADGH